MYKSLHRFSHIVLSPEEVKNDWLHIGKQLDDVKRVALKHVVPLSSDPVHEYFLKDVFDKTGAIKIRKDRFQELNSPLKKYFLAKWKRVNIRMVEDSINYYLRGNMFYVACMEIDIDLSIVKIIEEVEAIEAMLHKFFSENNKEITYSEFILLLGILDNRKSHIIEILSMVHQVQRYTSGLNLTGNEYKRLLRYVQTSTDDFYFLLMKKQFINRKMMDISELHSIIDKVMINIIKNKHILVGEKEIVRKLREANHPYNNALLVDSIVKHWKKNKHFEQVIGIEYGGMELPFVLNSFASLYSLPKFPINFIRHSYYSQIVDNEGEQFSSPFGYKKMNDLADKSILLLDDNVLTGKTLKHIISYLKKQKVQEVYLGIIGYSGKKRYFNMIMKDQGCINPKLLLEYAVVVTESPFTRTYNTKSTMNKNGVFNKTEKRIENFLKKNYPGFKYRLIES